MKVFDAGKTRMIGLPYGEKNYDDMLSRFHLIPERYGRTDGQICYINIALTRDKNSLRLFHRHFCETFDFRTNLVRKGCL